VEKIKIDDYVFYSSVIGQEPLMHQAYKVVELGVVCGSNVAWLEGKAGCVAVEALTKVNRYDEKIYNLN